jgi:hypothetical protein
LSGAWPCPMALSGRLLKIKTRQKQRDLNIRWNSLSRYSIKVSNMPPMSTFAANINRPRRSPNSLNPASTVSGRIEKPSSAKVWESF